MKARIESISQDFVKSIFDYREDGFLIWKVKLNKSVLIGSTAGTNQSSVRRYIVFNKQKYIKKLQPCQ